MTVHDGLIETDFGDWERLTFAEAAARDPELHRRWLGDPRWPRRRRELRRGPPRVRTARDELVAAHAGETVVVVSHVTPIKTLLRMGLDTGPSLLFRLHLDLASLSIVEFYPDGNASVRLANDTSHLPERVRDAGSPNAPFRALGHAPERQPSRALVLMIFEWRGYPGGADESAGRSRRAQPVEESPDSTGQGGC